MKANVRELMMVSEDDIWKVPPDQPMTLVFDDGEVATTGRLLHYNWYYWRLYREFSSKVVTIKHFHNNLFTSDTHIKVGQEMLWDVYENIDNPAPNTQWEISRVFYEITNALDNAAVSRLGEYRSGGSFIDLIELMNNPEIKKAKSEYWTSAKESEWDSLVVKEAIDKAHKEVGRVLYEDRKVLMKNAIKRLSISKNVSKGQLLQLVGPRGYVQDIDGSVFPYPIDVGYTEGMSSIYDIAIESRSAARALFMNTKPLQDSEYNNRTMQLHCSVTHSVCGKSCGHWDTVKWTVEEGDELLLRGMNMMVDGKPVMIWRDISDIIGKTIDIRTPMGCGNKDTQTICETCLGWLSRVIPPGTNLGYTLSSALWAVITQLMLSTKHFEGSTVSLYLDIDSVSAKFIKHYTKDHSKILLLKPSVPKTNHRIRIPQEFVPHLNDILITDVDEISPSRVSRCKFACIGLYKEDEMVMPWQDIKLTVAGSGAAITPEGLAYLKTNGWISGPGYIEFSLENWRYDQPLFMTPRRGDNIYLYLNEVRSFLVPKGAGEEGKTINITSYRTRTAALGEFITLLRTRLDVNMAIAAIVLRACMTRDADSGDYRLPRAGEPFTFTNTKQCLMKRALTGALAYEVQDNVILDPEFYIERPRPTHMLDAIFTTKSAT